MRDLTNKANAVGRKKPDLISKTPGSYSILDDVSSLFQPNAPSKDQTVTAFILRPSFFSSEQVFHISDIHLICSSLVLLRCASVMAIGKPYLFQASLRSTFKPCGLSCSTLIAS